MARYEFEVEMTCSGCSGAVERVLKRLGVTNVQINMDTQRVVVETDLPIGKIEEAIKKTGKKYKVV